MKLILIPFIVWLASYLLKRIVDLVKKQDRYFHYGGWPSTHAAITVSLSTVMLLEFGVKSAAFAISAVFMAVILTDALALRPIISKQSKALNEFHQQRLPDHVGHTWVEVLSGVVISFILTLVLFQFF
jgi:uncharacterized protein